MEGDERNGDTAGQMRETPMERRGSGECAKHPELDQKISSLQSGQRAIKSTADATQLDIQAIKDSLWGPNMNNGITGEVKTLRGSFRIIIALLFCMVLISGWNARQSNVYMTKLYEQAKVYDEKLLEHNAEPAHAVMEARYVTVIDKIDKLADSTQKLHDALDSHIEKVRLQHENP